MIQRAAALKGCATENNDWRVPDGSRSAGLQACHRFADCVYAKTTTDGGSRSAGLQACHRFADCVYAKTTTDGGPRESRRASSETGCSRESEAMRRITVTATAGTTR